MISNNHGKVTGLSIIAFVLALLGFTSLIGAILGIVDVLRNDGKGKHIVAVSFCVDESEAERFKNEKTVYASEAEERRAKQYDCYMSMAKCMSAKELREAFVETMIELEEIHRKERYGK